MSTTSLLQETTKALVSTYPNEYLIKNFLFGCEYSNELIIKNNMDFSMVLNIVSSDTKKLQLSKRLVKLSPFQSQNIEFTLKVCKKYNTEYFFKHKKLYITIRNDLFDIKIPFLLDYLYDKSKDLSEFENNESLIKSNKNTSSRSISKRINTSVKRVKIDHCRNNNNNLLNISSVKYIPTKELSEDPSKKTLYNNLSINNIKEESYEVKEKIKFEQTKPLSIQYFGKERNLLKLQNTLKFSIFSEKMSANYLLERENYLLKAEIKEIKEINKISDMKQAVCNKPIDFQQELVRQSNNFEIITSKLKNNMDTEKKALQKLIESSSNLLISSIDMHEDQKQYIYQKEYLMNLTSSDQFDKLLSEYNSFQNSILKLHINCIIDLIEQRDHLISENDKLKNLIENNNSKAELEIKAIYEEFDYKNDLIEKLQLKINHFEKETRHKEQTIISSKQATNDNKNLDSLFILLNDKDEEILSLKAQLHYLESTNYNLKKNSFLKSNSQNFSSVLNNNLNLTTTSMTDYEEEVEPYSNINRNNQRKRKI